jgi:hypothetical protein
MSPARRIEWFKRFLTELDAGERLVGRVAGADALRVQIRREIAVLEGKAA